MGRSDTRAARDDAGSAIVDFVLVTPLLLAVALAVLQFAFVLHVRTVLTAAAAEGARAAALAGASPLAGERRARTLLGENIASSLVLDVIAGPARVDGLPVMVVRVEARLPVLDLLGPSGLSVEGHALIEEAA